MENLDFIIGVTLSLTLALGCGFITQKLKLSPIVGYLIAGFIVGPNSPGVEINDALANQLAEIGIILLMFNVGLNFHPKDLLSVQKISLPGALMEIAAMTTLGTLAGFYFHLPLNSALLLGISVSIASTVILTRVLADNKMLHSRTGHIATGWLIVEDFFTIFILIMAPNFVDLGSIDPSSIISIFSATIVKIILLIFCIMFIGKRVLPYILIYIARTRSRDLFTLAIICIALGISLISIKLFGASMAIGAFLAGMLVGQSDFGERATADALPIKDTFTALFFISIGMLFNPKLVLENWKLVSCILGLVIIVKPIVATCVLLILRQPFKNALRIGLSLSQIGEFSFIIATLGLSTSLFDKTLANAIIATAIISITLNPIVYKNINFIIKFFEKIGSKKHTKNNKEDVILPPISGSEHRIIIVGYGPVGKCLSKILNKNGFDIVIIEMNIDTVKQIKKRKKEGLQAIYGDANNREILLKAGIEEARVFIISTALAPSKALTRLVRSLNPKIKILTHTQYFQEAKSMNKSFSSLQRAFSGEFAVAVSLTRFIMKDLNFDDKTIETECNNIEELLI